MFTVITLFLPTRRTGPAGFSSPVSISRPGAIVAGNVKIGNDSSLQNYTIVTGYGTPEDLSGLVRIGNGVRIGAHGMIIGGDHRFSDPSMPIHKQGIEPMPITICDDVWIGGNVNIIAGVTIGSGSAGPLRQGPCGDPLCHSAHYG